MRKIKVLNKEEFENFCIEMLSKCKHGARATYEVVSGGKFSTLPRAGGIIYELFKEVNKTRILLILALKHNNDIIYESSYLNAPGLKNGHIGGYTHRVSFQKIVDKHFYEETESEEI